MMGDIKDFRKSRKKSSDRDLQKSYMTALEISQAAMNKGDTDGALDALRGALSIYAAMEIEDIGNSELDDLKDQLGKLTEIILAMLLNFTPDMKFVMTKQLRSRISKEYPTAALMAVKKADGNIYVSVSKEKDATPCDECDDREDCSMSKPNCTHTELN